MNREQLVTALKAAEPELRARFGFRSLALFGSYARDEADAASDIDILVDFGKPASFDEYMSLKFRLEEMLGCPVDLVTSKAVRRELRPYIEKDAIRVA